MFGMCSLRGDTMCYTLISDITIGKCTTLWGASLWRVGHGTYIHSCQLNSRRIAVVHKVQAKNCKVFWLTDSNTACAVHPLH